MRSAAAHFSAGDVLYGRMRPYLNKVFCADFEGAASAEFIVFPKSKEVDSDFLKYLLHQRSFVSFASHMTSGDRPRIDFDQIGAFRFLLPPIREQRRIVARIDELFSDIEEGERCLARAGALLKQYRQSVLKAAVTGELTRDWREKNKGKGETGADLLRRILQARREAWEKNGRAKTYVEVAPPDASDLPELPEEWVWSSIGQLFDIQVGATPSRKELGYWNGDVPWVSSGEVAFCRISRTREMITRKAVAETSARLLPVGTVLLAMIGEGKTRGQPAILDVQAANSQNSAAILVSKTPVLPEFLYYVLCERYEETRREGKGGNQPALNSDRVRSIPVPLPSIEEQREIVDRLDLALSEVEGVRKEITHQRVMSGSLRQSILRAAFAGKLVPQDPADEPAAKLLERIAAERAAAGAGPRPARNRAAKRGDRAARGAALTR